MRGRRLVLGVLTVLVAVLGLASPAHAVSPPVIVLNCVAAENTIKCSVGIREGEAPFKITWEGGPDAYLDDNSQFREYRCFVYEGRFANTLNVRTTRVTVTDKNGNKSTAQADTPCLGNPGTNRPGGRRISQISCKPSLSALAGLPGGAYFVCDALWSLDVDGPVTVRWVSPQARRQPRVTVNSAEGWTTASFDCNNPGGPDLTFTVFISVTDTAGTVTTPATIPCGW